LEKPLLLFVILLLFFASGCQNPFIQNSISPVNGSTNPTVEVSKPLPKTAAEIKAEYLSTYDPSRKFLIEDHSLQLPHNKGTINARRAAEIIMEKGGQGKLGYVLMPYEIFSYNDVVGERTITAGFVDGTLHITNEKGEVEMINSVGSGVCRTSTALYQAARDADLKIIERNSHEFEQPYAKQGDDATVWYGNLDNRFQNNKNNPILIQCSVDSADIANVQIYQMQGDPLPEGMVHP